MTPKRLNGNHQAVNMAVAKCITHRERIVLVREHLGAVEPVEREQPPGRQFGPRLRHANDIGILEHFAVERDVFGFAPVVQLFAHTCADLLGDFTGVDRRGKALPDREQPSQLLQVGFDRGLHIGILQLAGEHRAVERTGAMHLAQRGRRGGMMLETFELLLPAGAELRHHAALDESPSHRRCFALQLLQLGGVFGRQKIGNGRHQLRDLHQRPFEPAERAGQRARVTGAVGRAADQPSSGITRGHAADVSADPRIARSAGGETVFFGVGFFAFCHYAFGQLSRIQRARLSSLTSPAASESIILVACACSGANLTPFLRKKIIMLMKAIRLLPSTNAWFFAMTESICRGKLCKFSLLVMPFVDRPLDCRT